MSRVRPNVSPARIDRSQIMTKTTISCCLLLMRALYALKLTRTLTWPFSHRGSAHCIKKNPAVEPGTPSRRRWADAITRRIAT
jgi:hypothetical protein